MHSVIQLIAHQMLILNLIIILMCLM